MKVVQMFLFMTIALGMLNCNQVKPDTNVDLPTHEANKFTEEGREYYQLKVYTFETDSQVVTTDHYLKEAYLPALKELGISPVGVFKQIPSEEDSIRRTYVLVPFHSIDQFLSLEEELVKDENHQTAGSDYINAPYDRPPYQRIESTLMKAFVDMPKMMATPLEGPRSERIYELRSYESPTEQYYINKVDMFNAGGEVKLFDRLAFNAVFYAEVISGAKMPNLVYMTTFSDQASRDEHWKAFVDAPEWKELISMEKYKNNVSHADIIFLTPTAYSDY
ncbi:MAG: NIPSNAP family protein [Cyclobacteriaceae bacterium]|nr:NIPSNAP family protein [Cyclobacteriaceae bacterium]